MAKDQLLRHVGAQGLAHEGGATGTGLAHDRGQIVRDAPNGQPRPGRQRPAVARHVPRQDTVRVREHRHLGCERAMVEGRAVREDHQRAVRRAAEPEMDAAAGPLQNV